MGKSRARLFLGLLLICLLAFTLTVPSAYATSVSVSYTTQDDSIISPLSSLTADGSLDLTITEATFVTGKYGKALAFDGVNDQAYNYGDNVELQFDDEFTLTAWVNLTGANPGQHEPILQLGGGVRFNWNAKRNAAGNFMATWDSNNGWVESSYSLTRNIWTFVAICVKSSSYERYYVNGLSLTNKSYGVLPDIDGDIYVGKPNVGEPSILGEIDQICIFNRTLSGTEIATLYTQSYQQYASGLVVRYDFDEGSGAKNYGYDIASSWTGNSKSLSMSQTASSVNSSCVFYNMPYQNATHKWDDAYYSKRANTTTLAFSYYHYVWLNFTANPFVDGEVNQTSGWYLNGTQLTALAVPYLGFQFVNWYSTQLLSYLNPFTFLINGPANIIAVFIPTQTSTVNAQVATSNTNDMWIWMGLIAEIALLLLGWKVHLFFHIIAIGVGVYFFFYNWQYQIVISNSTGVFLQDVQMYPPNFFYLLIGGLMVMNSLVLMLKAADSL